jgi:hypothetical protein
MRIVKLFSFINCPFLFLRRRKEFLETKREEKRIEKKLKEGRKRG